jgi:hypothetical protein
MARPSAERSPGAAISPPATSGGSSSAGQAAREAHALSQVRGAPCQPRVQRRPRADHSRLRDRGANARVAAVISSPLLPSRASPARCSPCAPPNWPTAPARGTTCGCSPGFPRCGSPVGSATRPARLPGRSQARPARSSRPSTRYSGARRPPRAHTAVPPRSHDLFARGNLGPGGYLANGEAGKRLAAVDATGDVHRPLHGVFLSVCCLARTADC